MKKPEKRKRSEEAFSLIELVVTMTILLVCLAVMLRAAVHLAYIDQKVRKKQTLVCLTDQMWFSLMDEKRWPVSPGLEYEIIGDEGREAAGYYRPVNLLLSSKEEKGARLEYATGYIQFP